MAYSIFDKYPTGVISEPIISPPTVKLASASDSGAQGDQITNIKNVRLEVSNSKSGAFSWLSGDANSTFDAATDTPVINGGVDVSLSPGYNTFKFYSMDVATGTVSTAAYLPVYMDPVVAFQQESQLNATLNKVALAYIGRPLTNAEYSVLRPILDSANGDPASLARALAVNTEFFAVYTVPDLASGIDRCYSTLFGRSVTAQESSYWSGQVLLGKVSISDLPYQIVQSASGADAGVLSARVIFMQQATDAFAANLTAAGVSERTLLEVERSAVQGVNAVTDIGKIYESLVSTAKNIALGAAGLAAPTVSLDSASDTGTKGDYQTSNSSVKVNVSGTVPGALAWLDNNLNGKFDPTADSVVVNGSVYASLKEGSNALTFYQMMNGVVSQASYLSLRRADANTPTTPPSAPVLDLRTVDDDGVDSSDNVTTKSLVRIDVSNLDPLASFAWLEKDGNGVYDSGKDIVLTTGGATATASVQLTEAGLGSNVTGFSAYQVRAGARSAEGSMSITYLKSVDTVKIVSGATVGGANGVVTLQFDRPIDWARLDANQDGWLQLGAPGAGAELGISIGGAPEIVLNNTAANWTVKVPTYSGVYLTINNVNWSYGFAPAVAPAVPVQYTSGNLLVVLTGVPDVTNNVTSDAWISITA